MRVMNLPGLQRVDRLEFARGLHASRLANIQKGEGQSHAGLGTPHEISRFLIAYMGWPDDEKIRNQWIAAIMSRSIASDEEPSDKIGSVFRSFGGLNSIAEPAFDVAANAIVSIEPGWRVVADIFTTLVALSDDKIVLRRGPSLAKAIDLCVAHGNYRRTQLQKLWMRYRDVAHILAAALELAREHGDHSMFLASWLSPDAVMGIADGFEEFGLTLKPHGQIEPVLRPEMVWRIPPYLRNEKSYLIRRPLSERQIKFLSSRKARKEYISKS
ncbi:MULTISPECIES: hypothetical protein [Bradyrhizobium]|uniref:hypothetical protein n=1 Tax=Bradyrhizobium TaxID=374 RepID=UPI0015967369|nr:hypothetical protein [Bradyrhizobium septentrionale]UGY22044.1 hypothetical protein HU675_0029080 [Bradyrhizobium septentrionale]